MAQRIEHAEQAFRAHTHNCAQSVLHAFQASHGVSDAQIAVARDHGGGKAEAGRCGALHAALTLVKDDPARQECILRDFQAATGSTACREIRRRKETSCAECVALAAALLVRTEPDHV